MLKKSLAAFVAALSVAGAAEQETTATPLESVGELAKSPLLIQSLIEYYHPPEIIAPHYTTAEFTKFTPEVIGIGYKSLMSSVPNELIPSIQSIEVEYFDYTRYSVSAGDNKYREGCKRLEECRAKIESQLQTKTMSELLAELEMRKLKCPEFYSPRRTLNEPLPEFFHIHFYVRFTHNEKNQSSF